MSVRPQVRFLDRTTPPHIVTLVLLAGLQAATMNIYLPSLPNMALHFGTEYRLMQLSVSLYLGISAFLQLFIGPLSDRFGRRPVMLAALTLFLMATIGTLYSPTVEAFLAFRMLQAVSVAGLVLSRAIVRDMVPQEEAASMIGYVTMGMALVPMVSPLVGGVLEQLFGWQSNFWFLLIAGCMVLALTWYDLGETAAPGRDGGGGQTGELPELLRSPRFWGYCMTMVFASGAFFAYLGGAPFVGSVVFGLSPAMLGFCFGAPAVGYALGNFLSGRYSMRLGTNRMIMIGSVLNALGLSVALILFYLGFGSVGTFFGSMCFVGLGNGLVLPNATAGMLSVRPHLAGTASGLGGAMMIGGGAALAAFAGSLLTPEAGAFPLLWVMFTSAALAILSIIVVFWREQQIRD